MEHFPRLYKVMPITIEFHCGTHIEHTSETAVYIANLLETEVSFSFNEIKLQALPKMNSSLLVSEYHRKVYQR